MQLWVWTFGMEYWGSSIQVWMNGAALIIYGLRCGIKRQMEFNKRWVKNFINPRATSRTTQKKKKWKKKKRNIALGGPNMRNVNCAQWKPFPHFTSPRPEACLAQNRYRVLMTFYIIIQGEATVGVVCLGPVSYPCRCFFFVLSMTEVISLLDETFFF